MKLIAAYAVAAIVAAAGAGCGNDSPSSSPSGPDSSSPAGPDSTSPSSPDATADHPFTGDDAWIAYNHAESGRWSVWLVHPDGSEDHQLESSVRGEYTEPDWSPDGAQLAFVSRERSYEYDMRTKKTAQLFDCERPCLGDTDPAYSPDGDSVAFTRFVGPLVDGVPSDCGIWIGDRTTGQVQQLTSKKHCDPYEISVRWSPDGKRLVYYRELTLPSGEVTTAVYTVAADGTGERRLTAPSLAATEPAYSPDGEWIVFYTHNVNLEDGDSQLFRMRPDGSGIEQLTDLVGMRAFSPRYSPDGDWILFTVFSGWKELWAIPASGGEPVVLADQEDFYGRATWQPSH